MISWIMKVLGIPKALSWLLLVIAVASLIAAAGAGLSHMIIKRHDDKVAAQEAKLQLNRMHGADKTDAQLNSRDQAGDERLKEAINDAARKDPAAGKAPVGPVSAAAADQLRAGRQQRHPAAH